jgi:two-component sensor histidine kinase
MSVSLTCILCLDNTEVEARDSLSQWQNFNINNGLPSNNVYSVLEDQIGNLWFATDNGVVRYNGYSFKIFNTDDGLPVNDVYKLMEDKTGRIWIYSLSRHFGFIRDDKYTNVKLPYPDRIIYPTDIFEQNGKVVFIYTDEPDFIYRLVFFSDKETRIFNIVRHKPFTNIFFSRAGNFWAYDSLSRVYNYSFKAAKPLIELKPVCEPPLSLYYIILRYPTAFSTENMLIYSSFKSQTIHYFNLNTCTERKINVKDIDKRNEYCYVLTSIKDSMNLFTNKFIYVLDTNFNIIRIEELPPIEKVGSQVSYRINSKNHFNWYTTANDGIWCNTNMPNILRRSPNLDILRGSVYLGYTDHGNLWWNRNSNVLYEQAAGESIRKWTLPSIGILRKAILYKHSIFLIATSLGLFEFNRETGQCRSFADRFTSISTYNFRFFENAPFLLEAIPDSLRKVVFPAVFDFVQAGSGTLYAPSIGGMLEIRIDQPDSKKLLVKLNEWGRFTNVERDSTLGNYFFFNNEVIRIYRPKDSSSIIVDKEILAFWGISNWTDIKVDRYGNIYILGSEGLWQLNLQSFKACALERGIKFDHAKMLLQNDRLVVAGKFGLATYQISGPMSVSERQIWLNIKFNNYRVVNDVANGFGGEIILNTDRGIMAVSTDLGGHKLIGPEGLKKNMHFTLKYPYSFGLNLTDTILLPPGTAKIAFDAINFIGNGRCRYRYRIKEVESNWQESESGEILLPGVGTDRYYTLECRISDDTWRSSLYSISLIVQPYWYQKRQIVTLLTILLIITIAIGIIGIILLTRYLVAKSNEKRRFQTELELRAIHSQINPHFIFNTLSTALFFISKERTSEAYNHVSKFSKLLRGYLKFSRERFITLADEIELLRQYIELQVARFQSSFTYHIDVDLEISPSHIMIPSLLLQPLVENAINHGLFNKGDNGILIIKFQKGSIDSELICIIDDNGIGREKAQALANKLKENKPSYGSTLTRELIDVFKKYDQMDISIRYIDKQPPEMGTTVELVIKNARIVSARNDPKN